MADLEQQIGGRAEGNSSTAILKHNLPWELREASIREAVSQHGLDLEKVADAVGLKPITIYQYARHLGILLPSPKQNPGIRQQKTFDAIRAEVEKGNTNLESVADAVGLKPSSASIYARKLGIHLQCSSTDEPVVSVVPDIVHIPNSTIADRKERSDSLLADRQARLEALVEERAPASQIGKAFGVCKERVRQLLHQAGLHGTWKQRRKELPEITAKIAAARAAQRTAAHTALLSLFKHRRRVKAQESGWAHEATVRYFESMKYECRAAQDYGTILALFQQYEQAQRAGKILSLEELGKPLDLHFVRVGDIIRDAGVPPMYGNRHRCSDIY